MYTYTHIEVGQGVHHRARSAPLGDLLHAARRRTLSGAIIICVMTIIIIICVIISIIIHMYIIYMSMYLSLYIYVYI